MAQEMSWFHRALVDREAAESPAIRAAGGARFLSLLGQAFGSELRDRLVSIGPAEGQAPVSVAQAPESVAQAPAPAAADSRLSRIALVPPGGIPGVGGDRHGLASGPMTGQQSSPSSTSNESTPTEDLAHSFRPGGSSSEEAARLVGSGVVRAWQAPQGEPHVEGGSRTTGEAATAAEMSFNGRSASGIHPESGDERGTSWQAATIFAALLQAEGEVGVESASSEKVLPLPGRAPAGGRLVARFGTDTRLGIMSADADAAVVNSASPDPSALSCDEALKGLIQRLRAGAISVSRVGDSWQFRGSIPGHGAVDIRVGRDTQGALNGLIRVADTAAMELALSMTRAADISPRRAEGERIRWKVIGPNDRSVTPAANEAPSSLAQSEES